MSDYFEEELIVDAIILALEHELSILFLPDEHKIISTYLHKHPNADINEILEILFDLRKNKDKINISKEQQERLKRHYQNIKNLVTSYKFLPWVESDAANKRSKLNAKLSSDACLIIKEAEKKLLNKKIINSELSPWELKLALHYFHFHETEVLSIEDKANIALLGVVNVRIPGGIRPVVLHSWGNLLNVADVNSMQENPDGGPAIDRGNRLAVINAIKNGNLNKSFLQKLPELNADIKKQNLDQKQKLLNEPDNI